MNEQITTTGLSRMGHETARPAVALGDARLFLARAEVDERLAEKLAEADGDMARILAIAAEERYACTEPELLAAYDEMSRASAKQPAEGARLGGPGDYGHPIVYLTLGGPGDYGHPIVYLTLRV